MYDEIGKQLISNYKKNMKKAAKQYLKDCNEKLPRVTGELIESGHIEEHGNEISVVWDAEHAIYVHENPLSEGFKIQEKVAIENIDKYNAIIRGDK